MCICNIYVWIYCWQGHVFFFLEEHARGYLLVAGLIFNRCWEGACPLGFLYYLKCYHGNNFYFFNKEVVLRLSRIREKVILCAVHAMHMYSAQSQCKAQTCQEANPQADEGQRWVSTGLRNTAAPRELRERSQADQVPIRVLPLDSDGMPGHAPNTPRPTGGGNYIYPARVLGAVN